MDSLSNEYVYNNYFDNDYDLNDFIESVELWLAEAEPNVVEEPTIPTTKKRKTPATQPKKPKKNYTMQLMELKQEIKDLRQEIEVRDAQLLSLIRQKS
jgi:hypothetical protein